MFYRISRVACAISVVVAALPLSLIATQRGFGLGAVLTVPTCCLGFWFALVSPGRAERIGWFAFSGACAFLLPACPWWQRMIEAVLHWVQDLLRSSQPTVLYSGAEAVALLALLVLPWAVGCLLGWLAAKGARRLLADSSVAKESQGASGYRFTLRGVFLSVLVCAVLTAWLANTTRRWQYREDTNRELFLRRFERSFTTGNVSLLADPVTVENHASQSASGVSEYRVTAPIKKHGDELWAVWTYWCDDRYPGSVSKFGYAESPSQGGLPPAPFPVAEYLREPTYWMIDGQPPLATRAEILDAPSIAEPGDTLTIVAKTDAYLECDLVIRPLASATTAPRRIVAPHSGVVRWDVQLDANYGGSQIAYEFQARTNRLYRAKTIGGTIDIGARNGENRDGEPETLRGRYSAP